MRSPIAAYGASATEADLLRAFTDLEDKVGLGFVWHVRYAPGQRLDGMPDLVCVVPPVVALLEIKTQRDRVSPRQRAVMEALSWCTQVVAGVVRPVPKPGEWSIDDALALMLAAGEEGEETS
jgi:hypothetical protein